MAKDYAQVIPVRPSYRVRRGPIKAESGIMTKYVAMAIFDTAANDRSGASNKTVASHPLGVYLPIGAIVTASYYDVKTTFTSAGSNAGTIALTLQSAGDLVVAIAISDGSTPYAAGLHGCLVGAYAEATVAGDSALLDAARKAGSMIKLTAERELTAVVAVDALTAGKLGIFVEYYIGL